MHRYGGTSMHGCGGGGQNPAGGRKWRLSLWAFPQRQKPAGLWVWKREKLRKYLLLQDRKICVSMIRIKKKTIQTQNQVMFERLGAATQQLRSSYAAERQQHCSSRQPQPQHQPFICISTSCSDG